MSVKGFKLSNGNVVRYDYSSLDNIVTDNTLSINGTAADAAAVGLELNDVKDNLDSLTNTVNITNLALSEKVDGAYADNDGYLYLTSNGEVVVGPIGPFAGGGGGGSGGGGSGNNAVISATNTTGWISTTLSSNESCSLSFTWSSLEDGVPTGAGSLNVKVNSVTRIQRSINQGSISIDVTQYLNAGSNNIRLAITDVYGNVKSLAFSVNVIDLSISATAFELSNKTATYNSSFVFNYTPVGAVDKTVYFIIDNGTPYTQVVTSTNRQQSFTVPSLSYGSHSFEVYFTAVINGETVSSNHLYYELLFVTGENDQSPPILTSSFNETSVSQYYTLAIPYRAYTHNQAESIVSFSATLVDENNHTTTVDLGSRSVGRTEQTFTYLPETQGTLTITMSTGSVSKSFTVTVVKSDIDIDPVVDGLELYLNAKGRSNSEENPGSWEYENISCIFDGFNYNSNGWYLDSENSTCLRISGKSRLTIPYKIFATDWLTNGKTIEFEFKTSSVRNYDTIIVDCMDNTMTETDKVGFEITPQSVKLKGSDVVVNAQYKEEEHMRVSFVVEGKSENNLIYLYINGVLSGVEQYSSNTNFTQASPKNIVIGSNDCTIDLYNIRVYRNSISRDDVINNWIADTQSGDEMLNRYNRNNILDKNSSIITIDKLPSTLPYLVIESTRLSNDKKDKVPCSGRFVNPINSSKSFTFTNATLTVQGTSSQKYPRKNYKIKFKNFVNDSGESSSKYYLRDENTSLPSNVFCFKADYASSEGANNVELVRLFNDACPYKTPPQVDNPVVRQGIDGFPIAIFWTDTTTSETIFIGKYNFNHDKSSGTFGFEDGDESWETLNNSSEWGWFKRADFNDDGWLGAFEARFPDLDDPYTDSTLLSQMAQWVNSTDREAVNHEIRLPTDNIIFHGGGHGSSFTCNKAPETSVWSKLCVYRSPTFHWDIDALRAMSTWNKDGDYPAGARTVFQIYVGQVEMQTYSSSGLDTSNQDTYAKMGLYSDRTKELMGNIWSANYNNYLTTSNQKAEYYNFTGNSSNSPNSFSRALVNGDEFFIDIPLFEDEADNYYAYWGGTGVRPVGIKNGDVIFAGKNTPYYGKKNINDTDEPTYFDTPIIYEGKEYEFDSANYRLAKFRNELSNWFDKDDTLFYYLFTELFLMVDSRVKNSFPTIYASHDGAKWCWLPYDMDTAIGSNNEGEIVFDYNLEDTDNVFNGSNSVMWKNVRDAFPKELASLYISMRSGVINYDEVEQRFEDHQSSWPEVLFNEDSYFKYIQPFVESGTNYLYMCVGSKESQRKWWLYNRFRYMDSKYIAGLAKQAVIVARAYQKSNFTAVPYADIYLTGSFDSDNFLVTKKAPRNKEVIIASPDNWNPASADSVMWIYSADQLKSLTNLSGFYLGNLDVSPAIKLQRLEIGSSQKGYDNPKLTSLQFGANTLLQYLDVQNCSGLTQTINLGGCTGIEEAHFEGTNIASVVLPDACPIKRLYLPDSITSLSLVNQSELEVLDLAGTSKLSDLRLENIDPTIIDGLDMVKDSMVDTYKGRIIRLVGFNKTYTNDDVFNTVWKRISDSKGRDDGGNVVDYPHLNGTITVNKLKRGILQEAQHYYPFLTINYTTLGDYDYQLLLRRNAELTSYTNNEITYLRNYAFYQQRAMTINCPNVTKLSTCCFSGGGKKTVTLGSLVEIGERAFQGVKNTKSIDFSHIEYIFASSFMGMYADGQQEVRLPSLKKLRTYSSTFAFFQSGAGDDTHMISLIDIPGDLTIIDQSGNELPDTNANVWKSSFQGNYLTAVILRSTKMYNFPNTYSPFSGPIRQAGQYSTVGQGYVYVPFSIIDAYKADWATKSNFVNLIDFLRPIEDYPEICDPDVKQTTYTSSTGMSYTRKTVINVQNEEISTAIGRYGTMENLEILVITGTIRAGATGMTINDAGNGLFNLTKFPRLEKLDIVPTEVRDGDGNAYDSSANGYNKITCGHYVFKNTNLRELVLGRVGGPYFGGAGYYGGDNTVGSSRGLNLIEYMASYNSTGGFYMGSFNFNPTTHLVEFDYTTGYKLTEGGE